MTRTFGRLVLALLVSASAAAQERTISDADIPLTHPNHTNVVADAKQAEVALGNPFLSDCDIFKVTARVLFVLQQPPYSEPITYFSKPGGASQCNGKGSSRIVYADRVLVKILSDAGPFGANGPQWSFEGQSFPEQVLRNDTGGLMLAPPPETPTPGPVVVVPPLPPSPIQPIDLAAVLAQLHAVQAQIAAIDLKLSDVQLVGNQNFASQAQTRTLIDADTEKIQQQIDQVVKNFEAQVKAAAGPGTFCRLLRIGC